MLGRWVQIPVRTSEGCLSYMVSHSPSMQILAVPTRKNVPVILLTGDDWTWLAKIKTVLNNGIGDCSRVFVAVHTASLGDWRLLIKQLSNEPKAEKLRYIFVLDKHAPKFSLDEDFYQQQLHQDLLVNVYSNGSWGSFQQLPIIQLPQVSSNISVLSSLR
uniref:Fatty acid synthase pseudo-KR domain-containing protein n=1 Tax=Timema tahoe TaxID=61484 RepID=A0A7R9NV84_9NEOP|nr:unnamed protein product [Timema tahoe]